MAPHPRLLVSYIVLTQTQLLLIPTSAPITRLRWERRGTNPIGADESVFQMRRICWWIVFLPWNPHNISTLTEPDYFVVDGQLVLWPVHLVGLRERVL